MTLPPIVARTCVIYLCVGLATAALGAGEFIRGPAGPRCEHGGDISSQGRPRVVEVLHELSRPEKAKGGLNLAAFQDERSALAQRKTWERVREYIEGGVMPPEDRPQPMRDEVGRLIQWISLRTETRRLCQDLRPGPRHHPPAQSHRI